MFEAFAKYTDFEGRASRSEYWMFHLFQVIVYAVLSILAAARRADASYGYGMILMLFMGLFALACAMPTLAVTARRLHDTNRSAWFLLLYVPILASSVTHLHAAPTAASTASTGLMHFTALNLASLACSAILFIFMVLPGTPGLNSYGPDPLGGGLEYARVFALPEDWPSPPDTPSDAWPAQNTSQDHGGTASRPTFGKRR